MTENLSQHEKTSPAEPPTAELPTVHEPAADGHVVDEQAGQEQLAGEARQPVVFSDNLDDIQPSRRRSLKQRVEHSAPSNTLSSSRVRSQPLPQSTIRNQGAKRVREPVMLEWEPEPMQGPMPAKPLFVGIALLAWFLALALLMNPPQQPVLGFGARALVPLAWIWAAALTFVPVQLRLALPGVGWQSMVGFGILGYLLAFVPAPTGWLLDLPDLPVYLLLFFAVFYVVTATMVPITYVLGQRLYKMRIHRLDVGRARRQAYEVGILIVLILVMAGLRVLTPATFGLLALVIVLTEALLLSQVQPEG